MIEEEGKECVKRLYIIPRLKVRATTSRCVLCRPFVGRQVESLLILYPKVALEVAAEEVENVPSSVFCMTITYMVVVV